MKGSPKSHIILSEFKSATHGHDAAPWAKDCAEESFTAESVSRSGKLASRHMGGQQDRRSEIVRNHTGDDA